MAHLEENTVLVESDIATGKVLRVIRSYLSARRAEEDLDLLREVNPEKSYATQTVAFIDN